MKLRDDINKIMDSVDIRVDSEMKNEILNSTTRKSEKRRFAGRRAVVVAMAAVLCIGTVGVAATEISKLWDETVAKMYNANSKTQEELVEEGYADIISTGENSTEMLAIEKDGAIVSLKQTLADKHGLYIYVDVKLTDGSKLPGGWYFDINEISVEGDNGFYKSMTAGMVEHKYDISDNQAGYVLYFGLSGDEINDISGKKMHLRLGDLKGQTYVNEEEKVLAKGEWDFYWTAKSNSNVKTIKLNNSYTAKSKLDGKDVYEVYNLKKIEISPLSVCISYDSNEEDYSEDHNIPFKIVMKDGKVYSRLSGKEGFETFGNMGYQNDKREVVMYKDYILDTENIDYVEVAGVVYDVE